MTLHVFNLLSGAAAGVALTFIRFRNSCVLAKHVRVENPSRVLVSKGVDARGPVQTVLLINCITFMNTKKGRGETESASFTGDEWVWQLFV